MVQGLYAAASGMVAIEERQSVIANNIANASTPGFKRQLAVEEGFYSVFSRASMRGPSALSGGPGGGTRLMETVTDRAAGTMLGTGNPLDLALSGPGFLAVQTADGERYTRNGRLSMDGEGFLRTGDGLQVLDADSNPINVGGGGSIEIAGDGSVKVDGGVVGMLRVVEFDEPNGLTRKGHHLYEAGNGAAMAPAVATQVMAGSLESSNVQMPVEMIQMMAAVRAYAANQQVITTVDETASQLINQVGMSA